MKDYLFVMGRMDKICQKELELVFKSDGVNFKKVFLDRGVSLMKVGKGLDFRKMERILAGTVKIAKLKEVFSQDSEDLDEKLAELLVEGQGKRRIEFGLSFIDGGFSLREQKKLALRVKKRLLNKGFSARALWGRGKGQLSTVVVRKQDIRELIIVKKDKKYWVGETFWTQNFEYWNKKDYGRPEPEVKKGMLPPKVARIMVNFSLINGDIKGKVMLDPFCGVGTILAEGLERGLGCLGADFSSRQINKTRINLEWIKKELSLKGDFQLFCERAERIDKIIREKVDFIITEPYLGPLSLGEKKLAYQEVVKIKNELEKLYERCFLTFSNVLRKKGLIIIALPSFDLGYLGKEEIAVKKVVDNREKLGYNLIEGGYSYRREKAVVVRNIYIFRKI